MNETDGQSKKRKGQRLGEIIEVFSRYGYASYVKEDSPDWIKKWFVRPDGERLSHYSEAERLRMAFADLGTTFMKLGQMLSLREDIVGPEYATELAKLQSETPPDPPESVNALIEAELGAPPAELFAEFDDNALGSASVGQVHAATLQSGESVVVKVIHEGVEDVVKADLELMMQLAQALEEHGNLPGIRPVQVVEEFQVTLLREINFQNELHNLERFNRNFADDPTVRFPTPFPDLCSRRVLTMERMDGLKMTDSQAMEENKVDGAQLVRQGANAWMEMIFRDNFFHVDPHPGNLLVLPDNVLGILDCGMVGSLDRRTRERIEDLMIAYVTKDIDSIVDIVIRMSKAPPGFDRDAFAADVESFMSEFLDMPVEKMDLVAMGEVAVDLAFRHQLLMPAGVSNLVRTFEVLGGTVRHLDMDFELSEIIQPYIKKIVQRRLSPQVLLRSAIRSYKDWERFLTVLPRELNAFLEKVQRDEVQVRFSIANLDKVANRLIYGLIGAALLLGSAMLWGAGVGPLVGDISILSILGLVISVGLVLRLLASIEGSGGL